MALDEASPVADDKIRCDACPVMCFIKPGAVGACEPLGLAPVGNGRASDGNERSRQAVYPNFENRACI